MFNKWQLVVLGLFVSQGVGLNAMENKDTSSPRRSLCGSREIKKSEVMRVLKHSSEFKLEKKMPRSLGGGSPSDPILEEMCKNDPRFAWLPI